MLLRIEAPHFTAGVEFDRRELAVTAAPILFWMVKRRIGLAEARRWAESKGYRWVEQ